MESLFRCPVCGAPLDRGDRAYRCPAGHSYDIAREGYTYLLPPNQKHSAAPGDDRDMAAARRDFLSKGYYDLLLNTLCCQILSLSGESPVIWDVGCGEGFYTSGIFQTLAAAGKSPRMAGTDISAPPPSGRKALRGLWPPPSTCRRRTARRTFCWTASPPWRWRNSGEC